MIKFCVFFFFSALTRQEYSFGGNWPLFQCHICKPTFCHPVWRSLCDLGSSAASFSNSTAINVFAVLLLLEIRQFGTNLSVTRFMPKTLGLKNCLMWTILDTDFLSSLPDSDLVILRLRVPFTVRGWNYHGNSYFAAILNSNWVQPKPFSQDYWAKIFTSFQHLFSPFFLSSTIKLSRDLMIIKHNSCIFFIFSLVVVLGQPLRKAS